MATNALVTSLTHVSSATTSVQTFSFTSHFMVVYLHGAWLFPDYCKLRTNLQLHHST